MINFQKLKDKYHTSAESLRALLKVEDGKENLLETWLSDLDIEREETAARASLSDAEIAEGLHLLTQRRKDELRASAKSARIENKKKFCDLIQSRIENGRDQMLRNYRYYMAADLAWDGPPINSANMAIDLYMQGKVDLPSAGKLVEGACQTTQENPGKYLTRSGEDDKQSIEIQQHRLSDRTMNLVRPFVRRSVAAQSNRYNRLYPLFAYDPRQRSMLGKLRADLVSQKAEIIADQYGYRHLHTQLFRHMFLYTTAVAFWDSWHTEYFGDEDDAAQKPRCKREGIIFAPVHPTRIFSDMSYPLSSINTDTGCRYLGYWDVIPYGEIKGMPGWFNLDKIRKSKGFQTLFDTYPDYMAYYMPTVKGTVRVTEKETEANKMDANAAEAENVYYGVADEDEPLILAHYYAKVVPKDVGFGEYPYPVWVHIVVAGDSTPVYAEILPSTPAFTFSYDEDDVRVLSLSLAHDLIPFQQQVSNLYSQLIYLMRLQSLVIITLNADMTSPEQRDAFKKIIQEEQLFARAQYIEITNALEEVIGNIRPDAVQVIRAKLDDLIDQHYKGIENEIRLAERMMMMSPNELGQFNPRETSASEAQEVATATNVLMDFKSQGIDEGRQAWKRIIYEAWMALGEDKVRLSSPERYPDKVIEAAGFETAPEEEGYPVRHDMPRTLIGTKKLLRHEYSFTARDGADRPINAHSAKTLMELTRYILSNEIALKAFIQMFGSELLAESISEIYRMAGSPLTLKTAIGFDDQQMIDKINEDPVAQQQYQQNQQQYQELVDLVKHLEQRIAGIEAVAEDYMEQQETQFAGPAQPV